MSTQETPIVDAVYARSRLHIQATLKVASGRGDRFQPASYANQGPCYYKIPGANGKLRDALIVDTTQAMANWLEHICWPAGKEDYLPEFKGIPYVKVLDGDNGNQFLTSSVLESHRLNSRYIYDGKPQTADSSLDLKTDQEFRSFLKTKYFKTNNNRPFPMGRFLSKIFDLDPACLLHGVFMAGGDGFEGLEGRARWARTLAASVHAEDPQRLYPGGAYVDHVSGSHNIPHTGDHATSGKITMNFILNVQALKDFEIEEDKHESGLASLQIKFLIAFALRKILAITTERAFFQPRSWCEFQFDKIEVIDGKDGSKWDDISAKESEKLKLANEFAALKNAIFSEKSSVITLIFKESLAGNTKAEKDKIDLLEDRASGLIEGFFTVSFDEATIGRGQNKTQGFKGITGYYSKDEFEEKKKQLEEKIKEDATKEELGENHEVISNLIIAMLKAYKDNTKVKAAWKAAGESEE